MRTTFLSAAMLLIAFIGIGTDSAYAAKRNSNNATTKAKEQAMQTITMDAAKAHIGFLASDELRGRKAGTNDAQVAAQYIISLLRQWGIKPLATATHSRSLPTAWNGRNASHGRYTPTPLPF